MLKIRDWADLDVGPDEGLIRGLAFCHNCGWEYTVIKPAIQFYTICPMCYGRSS